MSKWTAANVHPVQMSDEQKRSQYEAWKAEHGYQVTDELVAEALDDLTFRSRKPCSAPTVGFWWDDDEHCSICGRQSYLVLDHCHTTELCRGYLCRGCNVQEGVSSAARYRLWRLTAPWLEVGRRRIYAGSGTCYAPSGPLASLPFLGLLNFRTWWDEEEFWVHSWKTARTVANLLKDSKFES